VVKVEVWDVVDTASSAVTAGLKTPASGGSRKSSVVHGSVEAVDVDSLGEETLYRSLSGLVFLVDLRDESSVRQRWSSFSFFCVPLYSPSHP
jgi:hypothetical protein